MMDRSLQHRFSKIDKRLSAAVKNGKKKAQQRKRDCLCSARHHATAVAAIVLSGQPKIDEPLVTAWNRALQHYGIKFNAWGGMADQVRATEQLGPLILKGEESTARFTEIFAEAPIWLMQFTGLAMDARLLNFHLPDISRCRLSWGGAGYEDARRWPLLPSGTMTAGDPIPDADPRYLWLVLSCILTVGGSPFQDFDDRLSREEEEDEEEEKLSPDYDPLPFLAEIHWALTLDRKPEAEWSTYEKRRMRKLSERISRFEWPPPGFVDSRRPRPVRSKKDR